MLLQEIVDWYGEIDLNYITLVGKYSYIRAFVHERKEGMLRKGKNIK